MISRNLPPYKTTELFLYFIFSKHLNVLKCQLNYIYLLKHLHNNIQQKITLDSAKKLYEQPLRHSFIHSYIRSLTCQMNSTKHIKLINEHLILFSRITRFNSSHRHLAIPKFSFIFRLLKYIKKIEIESEIKKKRGREEIVYCSQKRPSRWQ